MTDTIAVRDASGSWGLALPFTDDMTTCPSPIADPFASIHQHAQLILAPEERSHFAEGFHLDAPAGAAYAATLKLHSPFDSLERLRPALLKDTGLKPAAESPR
jgi:hypothetical protein